MEHRGFRRGLEWGGSPGPCPCPVLPSMAGDVCVVRRPVPECPGSHAAQHQAPRPTIPPHSGTPSCLLAP